MGIKEVIDNAPYYSEKNVEDNLYQQMDSLNKAIRTNSLESDSFLNSENVTGVWYLPTLTIDGSPQLLFRCKIKKKTRERMLLLGEIFDFIPHDIMFDYYSDISDDDISELNDEILNGKIITIYDGNRE